MDRAEKQSAPALSREELLALYNNGERDFRDRDFSGIDLSGCVLSQCSFSGSNFTGANLNGADLSSADLSRTDFSNAILARANLSESELSWCKFSSSDLSGADLRRTKARAANFSNALMIRTRLNDADCLGAIMTNINGTAAQLESANLECVDLSGASLMNANLCGASCSWANFSAARMNWAIMSWCLLEAADLENANLTGANLQAANLSFSNMEDAILTGADLYFANLSGALLTKVQLPSARVSSAKLTSQTYSRSEWPRELLREWQLKGAIILDFESLPRDVQAFIREGECNLRMYFNTNILEEARIAIEVLIQHLTHNANTLRILSIANEKNKGQIAFYSPETRDIECIVSAFRGKTWLTDKESILDDFQAYQLTSHVSDIDIIQALNDLASNIFHIQALIPVAENDKSAKLKVRFDSADTRIDQKTQISWSSVTLPKVSR